MNPRRLTAVASLLALPLWGLAAVGCSVSGSDEASDASATAVLTSATLDATPSAKAKNKAGKKKPAGKKATSVSIRVLPQIAHQGKKVQSASSAKTVVLVSTAPRRKNTVTLQVRSGSSWKKVAQATTDKGGRHVFRTAARVKGKAATYRVVSGKAASAQLSTEQWLTPKFTDDFTGTKLSSNWQHRRQHYEAVGRTCAKGSPKAVKVGGGTVRLSVLKDGSKGKKKCVGRLNGKVTGKFAYRLNGHISTEDKVSFKYGFAAARVKFPRSQGQHGGFWLLPQEHVSGTVDPKLTGAEIDVVESFGEKGGTKNSMGLSSFTYHWTWDGRNGVQTKTGGYLKDVRPALAGKKDTVSSAYHVYSVEWTPQEYVFRIDGVETWRSKAGISGQPQFAILSLLSSDYELHRLEGGDKKLPQHMHVDWVRLWETPVG